jgi:hypothetical protein
MATPVNQDSITPVNTWEEEELELEEEEVTASRCDPTGRSHGVV